MGGKREKKNVIQLKKTKNLKIPTKLRSTDFI